MNMKLGVALLVGAFLWVSPLRACWGGSPQPEATPQAGASVVVQLQGSAHDDTLPSGPLTIQWSQVSGPGPVVFADASRADTTATFTIAGTYILRLTASDAEFTVSDDITVTVLP